MSESCADNTYDVIGGVPSFPSISGIWLRPLEAAAGDCLPREGT